MDNLTSELKDTRALAEELHSALRAEQSAKATLQVRQRRRVVLCLTPREAQAENVIMHLPLSRRHGRLVCYGRRNLKRHRVLDLDILYGNLTG